MSKGQSIEKLNRKSWTGAALAGLVSASVGISAASAAKKVSAKEVTGDTPGQCVGANACKGQSACATASGNSCGGSNSCAGKGMLEMTKAECDKKIQDQEAALAKAGSPKKGEKVPLKITFIAGKAHG